MATIHYLDIQPSPYFLDDIAMWRPLRSLNSAVADSDTTRKDWFDRARAHRVEAILEQRGHRLPGKNERKGPCPVCGGDDRFGLSISKQTFLCRQCGIKGKGGIDILVAIGEAKTPWDAAEILEGPAPGKQPQGGGKGKRIDWDHPQAVFDYHDAEGKLVYQNVRLQLLDKDGNPAMSPKGKPDKTFRQRRPDGKGGWVWGLGDVKKVPYRLPDVVADMRERHSNGMSFVEGEAKADLLRRLGFPATSVQEGCEAFGAYFAGATAWILPDNDEAGEKRARFIAEGLRGHASDIFRVDLPGLREGGDVVDWVRERVNAGKTAAAITEEYQAIEDKPWVFPPDPPKGLKELPGDFTEKGALRVKSFANTFNALLGMGREFSYDIFHDRKLVDGKELTDGIARELREAVVRKVCVDGGRENVSQAIERLCEANAFDPVVDYLARVQPTWDSAPRIETWLTRYLGAPDTPLNRAIGRRVLIAAVRRARKPGTKFDEVTVLESPEGKGKSSAIEILAGKENFSDQTILGRHINDRELQEKFDGVWLYEIADLTGISRAEVEAVKAMITRLDDRGRPAYGHFSVRRPRRCVLFATTNDDEYLKSQTGNRRFLPVVVAVLHNVDLDGLRRDRDQLWAEAAVFEERGVTIGLPPELWAAAKVEQDARLVADPWDDILMSAQTKAQVYDNPDVPGGEELRISSNVLLRDLLDIDKERWTDIVYKRVTASMRRLGWEKRTMRFGDGRNSFLLKGFRRPC